MLVKTCLLNLKLWSDVADNEVAKNTKFNTLKTKVNGLGKKIPDATALIHENQYRTDEQNLETKMKILMKKIPDTKGLVTKV